MALVRWNPWGDLDQLLQTLSTETPGNGNEYMGLPIDIRQTDSEYVIEASVPGFRPEDVEVTFEDGVLTVRGTRQEEKEDKDKKDFIDFTLQDGEGKALANVKVKIKLKSGEILEATTDGSGHVHIDEKPEGPYTVEIAGDSPALLN